MTTPLRPADPREARNHQALGGGLKPGNAVATATDVSDTRAVAGEVRWRVRFKATVNGTLKARYLQPDGITEYTANNPADVPVTANVETKLDEPAHYGEGMVKIIFTPGGNGTITVADMSHI